MGASERSSLAARGDRKIRYIRILLLLVLLVGMISMLVPEIHGRPLLEIRYVPQLLLGLAALVLIYNLHLAEQRRLLREVSTTLAAATLYVDRLEQFSVIDPQTQMFNRKYLDQLFNQQLRLLNRRGQLATLLLFDVRVEGQDSEAEMIAEVAFVLRSNFRGSDYIVRIAAHRFLVLLPDTNEGQAQFALNRLADKIESWNLENPALEMAIRHQQRACPPGGNFWEKLREMEEQRKEPAPAGDQAEFAEARGSAPAAFSPPRPK